MGVRPVLNLAYRDGSGWHVPDDDYFGDGEDWDPRTVVYHYGGRCKNEPIVEAMISLAARLRRWPATWDVELPTEGYDGPRPSNYYWLDVADIFETDWSQVRAGIHNDRWVIVGRRSGLAPARTDLWVYSRDHGRWREPYESHQAEPLGDPPLEVLEIERDGVRQIGDIEYARRHPTVQDVIDATPWFQHFLKQAQLFAQDRRKSDVGVLINLDI